MSGSRWSDLGRRSLSALVLAPAVLLCVLVGNGLYDALIMVGAIGMSAEWVGLCRMPIAAPASACVMVGVLLATASATLAAPVVGLLAAGLGALLCRGAGGSPMLALGSIYLSLPLVALIWLRGLTHGRELTLFLLFVVWATDIGAYVVGRALRGPRLAPVLSPGKTWSGAVGGLATALLVGMAAGNALSAGPAWLALPLGLVAQAGDLLESGIKRHVGVKDSGQWIPGHGGLLDRLDGLLAAAPVAAIIALIGRGRLTAIRTVSVLGSTGSVGRSTVDLLAANPNRFRVRALVGGRNAALLAAQARDLRVEVAVIADVSQLPTLEQALAGSGIAAEAGAGSVIAAAELAADWTMAAITGAAGLPSTLAAIRRGGAIALANKEALVCAGMVMLRAVAAAGATLLPVDSEHNAIFQAMAEGNGGAVEKIVLTASGGPFRNASLEEMARATPEAALRHPIWSMGAKISIDSATMFNKGLELIEAARLFGLEESRIGVLVHPQSVIHGIVHYQDGSMLAQLGSPDMRIPIAHALAWPSRLTTGSPRLDLAALGRLEFFEPDLERFPALRLARDALRAGGGAPTILSAANEVAVDAFLLKRLGFTEIAMVVEAVLDRLGSPAADTLDAVLALDAAARRAAETIAAARAA